MPRDSRPPLPSGEPSSPPVSTWEYRYRRSVIVSDVLCAILVVAAIGPLVGTSQGLSGPRTLILGLITVAVVLCSVAMNRSWNRSALGQGAEEFARLGRGLFYADVALGLGGLAFSVETMRPWVFLVVPAVGLLAFPMRYVLRKLLHRSRREGQCLLPVMVAGNATAALDLITRTKQSVHLGWRVEAACTSDALDTDLDGVPVVGRIEDVAERVRRGGYRILAVAPDPYWTPKRLQQLAWKLEGSGADLVVAPMLMEVAGPRLHVSAVLGMPLLHVSAPAFTGVRRVVKDVVDRVGSLVLLALLLPVMIVAGAVVALDSRGPVFYRQRRVGKDGQEFTIVKFRTMVVGADRMVHDLEACDEGAGLLFKIRKDPRITRSGAVLRRFSIDEMPQLFNVLLGQMSLVGPRPPLPEECARYEPDARRRLLVKPGLTGLWQVSGRSDLPWDESVRLDLRYVEDWSLALDAVILWKTMRAVFSGQGAY